MLGWPYARLEPDVRKAFEVALHTGAGLALAWLMREELAADVRDPAVTALLAAPAALAGLGLEPVIESTLSNPRAAAAAQIASGLALAAVDARAQTTAARGGARADRRRSMPGALCIGLAQAAALVPGVSRNGATLTAARALGFDRRTAAHLSWRAGLPIVTGAGALKGARLARRGLPADLRAPFAAGAVAAFGSTLAAGPLRRRVERSWLPLGAYRVALGAIALYRLHRLQWPRG